MNVKDATAAAAFALLSAQMLVAVPAHAGSFSINENSANDLGRANAGRAVSTQDAIAAYGNPAMMVHQNDLIVTSTISYIDGSANFTDEGSADILGNSLGGDTDGFFDSAFVPALEAIYPVNDRLALGLAVNAPFGLSSTYDDGSLVRYQGLGSKLTTINVNPSVGYALSNQVSVGIGLSVQYAKAELSNAVDFGTVCFAQVGPAGCGALGLAPQTADGLLEIEGDDISVGWNVGVAFTPNDRVTVGVTYRSEIDHVLEGEADFTVPTRAAALAAGGVFVDTGGTAELELPGALELGIRLAATDRLDLYADWTTLYWSDLEALRVDFENPLQPDSSEELEYETSSRYAVGADYTVSPDWTVRAGIAYDETPSQPGLSTVRIPDNDRLIYAVGATYTGLDFAQIDIAYNRLAVDDTDFRRLGPTGGLVVGEVSADVNIFSVGATKRF